MIKHQILHQITGRTRLKVENRDSLVLAEQKIRSISEVTRININQAAKSIVVEYNSKLIDSNSFQEKLSLTLIEDLPSAPVEVKVEENNSIEKILEESIAHIEIHEEVSSIVEEKIIHTISLSEPEIELKTEEFSDSTAFEKEIEPPEIIDKSSLVSSVEESSTSEPIVESQMPPETLPKKKIPPTSPQRKPRNNSSRKRKPNS